MQPNSQQYFYDGIDSYLYSLVHYSGEQRPDNAGNYQQQQPYPRTDYTNIQNQQNVRQNIGENHNHFNRNDNRNLNSRENGPMVNNRYYNDEQSEPRQCFQNPYYNPYHLMRYPQNKNYVNPRHVNPWHVNPWHVNPRHDNPRHVEPRHVNPRNANPRHVETRPPSNRQVNTKPTHTYIKGNAQQIPGNICMIFDQNNTPENTSNQNFNNDPPRNDLGDHNQSTETDLFQIDTRADFSNLEKNRLEQTQESTTTTTSSENTNVVQGIISAFTNASQENAPPPQSIPNATRNQAQKKKSKPKKKKKNNATRAKANHSIIEIEPKNNTQDATKSKLDGSVMEKVPNNVNTVICLDSDSGESEDDDVIEIPRSPIPLVYLDDSDAEMNECMKNVENPLQNEIEALPGGVKVNISDQELQIQTLPDVEAPSLEQNITDKFEDKIIDSQDEINPISTPKGSKKRPSDQELQTSIVPEVESSSEPNIDTNSSLSSKSKKRQKRKRECVENIENGSQNDVETSENVEENTSNQELQTSIRPEVEPSAEQNITEIETNSSLSSKSKKRQKRKRECAENVQNGSQNDVETSENVEENTSNQELQTSIRPEVEPSAEQNISEIEINSSLPSKNKKRQKRKRECVESVENGSQNEVETSENVKENTSNQELQTSVRPEVELSLEQTTAKILKEYMKKVSTPMKDSENDSTFKNKKRLKKKRQRPVTKSMTGDNEEETENDESSVVNQTETVENSEENQETPQIPIVKQNTIETSGKSTSTPSIDTNIFATPKSKKRRQRNRQKKKNTTKLSDGSDDFLMNVTTDAESIQSNDSIYTNEIITSKKNIIVPKTLIPDIYETESSCSDVFDKDTTTDYQNPQPSSTSKRSFAELDLIQFANMITTTRSLDTNGSDRIVCAKSSHNCSQTTSVSFSTDNCHRVIATASKKFQFNSDESNTSSSSDEPTLRGIMFSEIRKSKDGKNDNTDKNPIESNTQSMSDELLINDLNKSQNSLSNTIDKTQQQNITTTNLVPLNNDEDGIDVNYEQFINQLENKIREPDTFNNSETSVNTEPQCSLSNIVNESTEVVSKAPSDNENDDDDVVECITPKLNNEVILLDSDHDSSIVLVDSDLSDVDDICLNVTGGGPILNVENSDQRKGGKKRKSGSLNVSKEEERALNLKMRFETYWTPDRESFYNRSWGGERYDHEEEQGLMTGSSLTEWANPIDKIRMRRSLESKVRCRNCRQQGHMGKNCPVPIKPCSMCGSRKHREFKCNESCCLTCFSKDRRIFTPNCKRCLKWRNIYCKTCHNKGHIPDYCPDLWRRYHLTIKPGEMIQPTKQQQKKSTNWCSICAQKGHSSDKCRYYYNILYTPPDPMLVRNYSDLYDYNSTSSKRRKLIGAEDNHWDIHQVHVIKENNSFVEPTTSRGAINTATTVPSTSGILSRRPKYIDKIDLESVSSTSLASNETVGILSRPKHMDKTDLESVSSKSLASNDETEPVAVETVVPAEPIVSSVTIEPVISKSITTTPNVTTITASKPVTTVAVSSGSIVAATTEPIVIESNTIESHTKKLNDDEQVAVEPIIINPNPNITKSTEEQLLSAPESVASTEQVIVRTNIFQSITQDKFDLDFPLTQQEIERITSGNIMEILSDQFQAHVYLKTGKKIKYLHVTANVEYRHDIHEYIRQCLITSPQSKKKNKLLIDKIRMDYPLINEVQKLKDPYALFEKYNSLLAAKKHNSHQEVIHIIKKMNIFRRMHCCRKQSKNTRDSLQILRDFHSSQNKSKWPTIQAVHKAYLHIFKNIKNNQVNQIIHEFQQVEQQQLPELSQQKSPKIQKTNQNNLFPVQKSIVSSTNDGTNMELIKYVNMLEMAATNSKHRKRLKKCKHSYDVNKSFSKTTIRALMTLGRLLKVPFPYT